MFDAYIVIWDSFQNKIYIYRWKLTKKIISKFNFDSTERKFGVQSADSGLWHGEFSSVVQDGLCILDVSVNPGFTVLT